MIYRYIRTHQLYIVSLMIMLIIIANPFYALNNSKIWALIHIGEMLIFIVIFCMCIKDKFITKMTLLMWIYCLIGFCGTVFEGGDVPSSIIWSIRISSIYMFTEYSIRKSSYIFIKTFFFYIIFMATLNLLLMLIFSDGINISDRGYRQNLLGIDNSVASVLYPAIVCGIFCCLKEKKYFRALIYLILITLITEGIVYSLTSIVGMLPFLIFGFFYRKKFSLIKKILGRLNTWICIYLILFVGISILRIQDKFSWILVTVFHKSSTLSARTYIWEKAMELCESLPIFGFGKYNNTIITTAYFTPANLHSLLFEILISGGIIGTIVFILIVCLLNKKLKQNSRSLLTYWTICFFSVILIMGLAESTIYYLPFYMFVAIAYNISYLDRGLLS